MRKTSFGYLDPILSLEGKIRAEYLIFERQGRGHQHPEYESFAVLSGSGKVISGDIQYQVEAGDIVTVPPHTNHYMIPSEESTLCGLLWYHDEPAIHRSTNPNCLTRVDSHV